MSEIRVNGKFPFPRNAAPGPRACSPPFRTAYVFMSSFSPADQLKEKKERSNPACFFFTFHPFGFTFNMTLQSFHSVRCGTSYILKRSRARELLEFTSTREERVMSGMCGTSDIY